MKSFIAFFGLLFFIQGCAQKEVKMDKISNLYKDVKYVCHQKKVYYFLRSVFGFQI